MVELFVVGEVYLDVREFIVLFIEGIKVVGICVLSEYLDQVELLGCIFQQDEFFVIVGMDFQCQFVMIGQFENGFGFFVENYILVAGGVYVVCRQV